MHDEVEAMLLLPDEDSRWMSSARSVVYAFHRCGKEALARRVAMALMEAHQIGIAEGKEAADGELPESD